METLPSVCCVFIHFIQNSPIQQLQLQQLTTLLNFFPTTNFHPEFLPPGTPTPAAPAHPNPHPPPGYAPPWVPRRSLTLTLTTLRRSSPVHLSTQSSPAGSSSSLAPPDSTPQFYLYTTIPRSSSPSNLALPFSSLLRLAQTKPSPELP